MERVQKKSSLHIEAREIATMNLEKTLKALIPYGILILLTFYALPKLIIDTGSAMFILLSVIPLICFLASIHYGYRHGFNILYLVLIALLFAPTILIYYNSSAWVYIPAYTVIALIGTLIGNSIRKAKKN